MEISDITPMKIHLVHEREHINEVVLKGMHILHKLTQRLLQINGT